MNFIDVTHFTISSFKLGMSSLKMALSCRNMSEWRHCNDISVW